MKETFGKYIKSLRTKSGMTLTQLAALLGMDSANLCKVENGKRDFDEKRLIKLSSVFSLDIDNLRDELVSEKFAQKVISNSCSTKVFELAEKKVNYYKKSNFEQKKISIKK